MARIFLKVRDEFSPVAGKSYLPLLIVAVCLLGVTACAPEVGSEGWCEDMKEKAKVDWSTREASDFAKHCLFKK